jgi:tripartite-type tricarboxylate transporter receptor subunit TctC
VPTVAEAGIPGFENTGWFGLMATKATPSSVVDKIQRDTAKVLADPAFKAKLAEQGMTPVGDTPKAFAASIEDESVKWAQVIRDRKLSVN